MLLWKWGLWYYSSFFLWKKRIGKKMSSGNTYFKSRSRILEYLIFWNAISTVSDILLDWSIILLFVIFSSVYFCGTILISYILYTHIQNIYLYIFIYLKKWELSMTLMRTGTRLFLSHPFNVHFWKCLSYIKKDLEF